MNHTTEEILYIKYAKERNREFAVRTEILENIDGKRSVKKTPLYPEGKAHVAGLVEKYHRLEPDYEKVGMFCNRAEADGDSVRLEYLMGESMEEYLDGLLDRKKKEEAEMLLKQYIEKIQALPGQESFCMTEEFKEVFGDAKGLETMASVSHANIDMVCQNVMMDENRWTMIDYEWTFFFPVPTAFLVYRVLHYYLETHGKRSVLNKEALYTWAGITKEERKVFHEMEHHFQQHLTSEHVPMREMYGAISPGTYPVRHLVTKEQIRRGQERMQIFFADENGFREERSIYYKLENGEFHGTIEIPEHTEEIRLDPCDGMGLCQIEELSFDVGMIGEIITSDGITEDGEIYLMNAVDPQLYLGRVPEGAKTLTVHLYVTVTEADSVKINEAAGKLLKNRGKRLRKEKEKRRQAEAQLAEKAEELSRLQAELAQKTAKIEEMEQTKVWKLYRKYRTIRERN